MKSFLFSITFRFLLASAFIIQNVKGDEEVFQVIETPPQELAQEDPSFIDNGSSEGQELWNTLSELEQSNLMKEMLVTREESSSSSKSFFFSGYKLLDASPLEAIATFWDTDMTKDIIPYFKSIKIESNDLNSIKSICTVAIPSAPWPYNTDTIKNEMFLQKISSNNYKIFWRGNGVKGKSVIKTIEGTLEAITYERKTLLFYQVSLALDKSAYFIKISPFEDQKKRAKGISFTTIKNLIAAIEATTSFEKHIEKVIQSLGCDATMNSIIIP